MATVIWAQVESEMVPVGGEKDIISKSATQLQLCPASRFVHASNEFWPMLLHDDTIEVGKKGK